MYSRLALSTLCGQGWPAISDPLLSNFQMLYVIIGRRLPHHAWATAPCLFECRDQTQGLTSTTSWPTPTAYYLNSLNVVYTADIRLIHCYCSHMSLDTGALLSGLPDCKFLLRKGRKQVIMLHGFSQGIDGRFQGKKQFNHKSLGTKGRLLINYIQF